MTYHQEWIEYLKNNLLLSDFNIAKKILTEDASDDLDFFEYSVISHLEEESIC